MEIILDPIVLGISLLLIVVLAVLCVSLRIKYNTLMLQYMKCVHERDAVIRERNTLHSVNDLLRIVSNNLLKPEDRFKAYESTHRDGGVSMN